MDALQYEEIASPLGPLILVTHEGAVCALEFADALPRLHAWTDRAYGVRPVPAGTPSGYARALDRYFEGQLGALDSIPTNPRGTPFQRRCWQALRELVPGAAVTYAEQALRVGRPRAARAVGLANARNPVAIVVPCHRLIGADGSLTGYAGGLARKAWLLEHERRHSSRQPSAA